MNFVLFYKIFSEESLIFAGIHLYYYKACLCSETISSEQTQDETHF